MSKSISLFNLHPESQYVFCGYFENEFKNHTENATCIEFTTSGIIKLLKLYINLYKVWQEFSKISI